MTNILIVTQFYPPESMGGAHRWEKLGQHLDDDIEPHVLAPPPTFPFGEFERTTEFISHERREGIPVTRLWTYQPREAGSWFGRILNHGIFAVLSSLYVLLHFWRYDSIVTMSAPHTTFLAGVVGKATGRWWVVDIFDLWLDNAVDLGYVEEGSIPYRLVAWLEAVAIERSDGVMVITDTMADFFREKYPSAKDHIGVFPFGIDAELFNPKVEEAASSDVIYTGNLGTGQALIPFIRGFAELSDEPSLTIVGDGERRNELEELVQDLDIQDQVTFTGYISRAKIPGLLAGSKVSIVPLKTDYQLDYARPTKLLETMAVGTPYVASNVKEIADLSQEHRTGIAAENESEEIESALKQLLTEPERRSEMQEKCIRFVETNHEWETISEDVSTVLTRGF